MSEILQGLKGAVCLVDDILVNDSNKAEHDAYLKAALQCIKQAGLTLSKEKCEFNKSEIKFLGQLVHQSGAHPDPDKVCAIRDM